ncbi:Lipoprotein [Legionella beliardensis]|uniref:Endolytic peptidoglycan transglycosylase RlpA n=1 Tax=Legionella beliardensis TaxID=91822 RepID=A0A378I1M9_9GAMM|nr:septal ring lytic transglycosylase RlpA family protein [Legionella beliardensis]STX29087.1 Lipoprotein [Legionella beliardensis]
MNWLILILAVAVSGCYHEPGAMKAPAAKQQAKFKKNTLPKKAVFSKFSTSKDGAPPGPPPTRFPHVKPAYEPLSRYGNPESYKIEGRTYSILRTASGYKTRGIASWYGTKFHSQRTSSGEDYNMYAMTAAHKTLPLPTYVKVKNLSNGREAIVKVNDRGPFRHDRVIDLSYAAATKLGLLPHGTAPVEIEALTIPGKSALARYYVQAGAFVSKDLANSLQKKLTKFTPSPVVIENHQEHFIVKVGPFANKQMTESFKMQLAAHGILGSFTMLQ